MASVLIVAPEDDAHGLVVQERLADRNVTSFLWNTTWFPWKHCLSWSDTNGFSGCSLGFPIEDIRIVWWRRFRKPTPDPRITDSHVSQFCISEAIALLQGFFAIAPKVINAPSDERLASNKVLQLHLAKSMGLRVPRTIISNHGPTICQFIREVGAAVCKTLVCNYPHSIATRSCSVDDFKDDQISRLAPTIVQEQIPCFADIRVCIIGQKVFCGQLVRDNAEEEVDWRMTPSGWEPHELPLELSTLLIRLVRNFRLDMASIDLRLTPNGEYVFFEVNPTGQFLFLEIDAGLPITESVADYFIGVMGCGKELAASVA